MIEERVLHCPNANCRRPILTEANLVPGTYFKIKCPYCQEVAYVNTYIRDRLLRIEID